jgi:hypothetical protein
MTGFFGMNFSWLVGHVESPAAFAILGVAAPLASAVLIWFAIKRRGTPVQPDQDAFERLVANFRKRLK